MVQGVGMDWWMTSASRAREGWRVAGIGASPDRELSMPEEPNEQAFNGHRPRLLSGVVQSRLAFDLHDFKDQVTGEAASKTL